MTENDALVRDQTGWLIELPLTAAGGGRLCWAALKDGPFPLFRTLNHSEDYDFQKIDSPLRFTTDSNEALRFARKIDAERFMAKFDRYLLHAIVTEHSWSDAALRTPQPKPAQDEVERVARAIHTTKGLNPDCLYQHNFEGDWPEDERREYEDPFTGEPRVQLFHRAWRRSVAAAIAAIAAMRPTDERAAIVGITRTQTMDKAALIALAESCEGATKGDWLLNRAIYAAIGGCNHERTERYVCQDDTGFTCLDCGKDTYGAPRAPNYTASFDAALMLVPKGARVRLHFSADRRADRGAGPCANLRV